MDDGVNRTVRFLSHDGRIETWGHLARTGRVSGDRRIDGGARMADLDTSLEHRRALKRQAARSGMGTARDEAASGPPGEPAPADPRLLRIEQKLDRLARQISGLPTVEGLRAAVIVLASLSAGPGLMAALAHP